MRLIVICFLFACGHAFSQVIVRINDVKPVKVDVNSLAEFQRHVAVLQDHGKQIKYEGVLVHDVLVHSGADFGKGLRGKQLSSYVTAIGNDGYQAVYALADFGPSITNSAIILADTVTASRSARTKDPFASSLHRTKDRPAPYAC